MPPIGRTPPADVLRELRREVGFGCPIPDPDEPCGNPYLYWHHFDPPYRERPHHDPSGMIALCAEHHAKADAGAYAIDQLREFKKFGAERAAEVRGRFDWMRREVLWVVGGNFYYETPTIFALRGQPVVWINRGDDGYLLLNLRMLSVVQEPRAQISDNYWVALGNPDDVRCPPNGRLLGIHYANDDRLQVEFFDVASETAAAERWPSAQTEAWGIEYPVTAAEVNFRVGGTEVDFGPGETRLGPITMTNGFLRNCGVGIDLT
jgi:hypothetical protein